jgi:hypothetical protein
MLAKTENLIGQKLQEIEEFRNLEDILTKTSDPKMEQDKLSAVTEYKDIVAEIAYLAGYKQAIKEAAAEQFAENPAEHMDIIQTRKLLESLGIGAK